MGDVIRFPVRHPELEELRAFGSVGGLTVSMLREKGDETSPITIALVSEDPRGKLQGVMAFKPEGRAVAEIVGAAVIRALLAAGLTRSAGTTIQNWMEPAEGTSRNWGMVTEREPV